MKTPRFASAKRRVPFQGAASGAAFLLLLCGSALADRFQFSLGADATISSTFPTMQSVSGFTANIDTGSNVVGSTWISRYPGTVLLEGHGSVLFGTNTGLALVGIFTNSVSATMARADSATAGGNAAAYTISAIIPVPGSCTVEVAFAKTTPGSVTLRGGVAEGTIWGGDFEAMTNYVLLAVDPQYGSLALIFWWGFAAGGLFGLVVGIRGIFMKLARRIPGK